MNYVYQVSQDGGFRFLMKSEEESSDLRKLAETHGFGSFLFAAAPLPANARIVSIAPPAKERHGEEKER